MPAVRQADRLHNLVDTIALGRRQSREKATPYRPVTRHGQLEILEHSVLPEHGRLLELATDTRLSNFRLRVREQVNGLAEPGRSVVRARLARDDVHHSGLARAIRPNDAPELARLDVKGK